LLFAGANAARTTPTKLAGQASEAALDFFGTNDGLLLQQDALSEDYSGSEFSDSEPEHANGAPQVGFGLWSGLWPCRLFEELLNCTFACL
jgi:hypothetical protein